ncbi:hypothetical protein [Streptomyces sp. NPDC046832]|uniref:hypothetical protein n=1 Tax=Streptomyces sp. NPDC046832 TaxID=3155020 RepID=UPI0033C676F7
MTGLRTGPLDASTWPDFAGLVERHKGVRGGCWCMAGEHCWVVSRDVPAESVRAGRTAGS